MPLISPVHICYVLSVVRSGVMAYGATRCLVLTLRMLLQGNSGGAERDIKEVSNLPEVFFGVGVLKHPEISELTGYPDPYPSLPSSYLGSALGPGDPT
eukprot:3589911-Rhodomonas_salina.3